MKKIASGVVLVLILFCACDHKKKKMDLFEPLTELMDSAKIQGDSTNIEQPRGPVPMQADESFNDFFYNFASDPVLQAQRIVFPLPYYSNNVISKINEKHWKYDPLYVALDFYSLIFDKESDMDIAQDTALNSVQFEWIYMNTAMMKKYYFERRNGAWMLEAINLHPIEENENKEFINFFHQFVNDSIFQSEHIADPLVFVTVDPDDDFSIIETTLDLNQWLAFMPPLPKHRLTNINYGQSSSKDSPYKILALKGVGNGFSNILYFERSGNTWKLHKFEDLSD